jgi:hypothetical protein
MAIAPIGTIMTIPNTITVGELALRYNPTAFAIWAAVKRGEARVRWDDLTIIDLSWDSMPSELYLVTADGGTVLALYETRLIVEVITG